MSSECRQIDGFKTVGFCFDLILKAGGIPVLAHPNTLEVGHKELLILIKKNNIKWLNGNRSFS